MYKKITTTSFLLLFFNILPLFAAHKVTKVFTLSYQPLDGITVTKTFSGNYGILSFTSIAPDKIAFLCNVERKVKIFSTATGQLEHSFSIPFTPQDFTYADGFFYILSHNRISQYHTDGTRQMDFPISEEFKFIDRLQFIDEKLYVLTSEGKSYAVLDHGTPIDPGRQPNEIVPGWLFRRGFSLNTVKVNDSGFILNLFENATKQQERYFHVDKKLGCVTVIGIFDQLVYLDLQVITNVIPLKIERNIRAYSLEEDRIVDIVHPPDCYYLYLKRDINMQGDEINQLITTEQSAELVNLSFDRTLKKTIYPECLRKQYHYNEHLPKTEPEWAIHPGKMRLKSYQTISRSEIIANADAYEKIEWTCSEENTSYHQLIQLHDGAYIRTPEWVVVGEMRRMPYKWGGFTHIDGYRNRISDGAYAGDDYCSRTDPFAVSYGDTYCVGVDCSGFVSRVWGRTEKEWTGSLPDISTALPSWSIAKEGDIANKAGSHTMLIVENNPSGTINIIHANGSDWSVSYWTYSLNGLVDYIPRKYDHVIDNPEDSEIPEVIVLHQNYPNPFNAMTKISYYLPEPSRVKLDVYNIRGDLIETLFNGHRDRGNHTFDWDASPLASGIYFYYFQNGAFSKMRKCILVK